MAERLVADYGTINGAANHLSAASSTVSATMLPFGSPFLGSSSVEGALAQTTTIHTARGSAVADLLKLQDAGVRQAVLDLIAADHAASAQVQP